MVLSKSDIAAIRQIVEDELEKFWLTYLDNIAEIRFKSKEDDSAEKVEFESSKDLLDKIKQGIVKDDGGQGC